MEVKENETEIETVEPIHADELTDLLNEEVTLEVNTTLFGFLNLMSGLEMGAEVALQMGLTLEGIELLALKSLIEDENKDVHTAYEAVRPYITDMNTYGVPTDTATVLPAVSNGGDGN